MYIAPPGLSVKPKSGIGSGSVRIENKPSTAGVARSRDASIVVPTVVVAQVVRSGGRQATLRCFLADSYLSFVGLDYPTALEIGALLGDSRPAHVVDACVVVCARRLNHCPVVTSDPEDLRKLDPTLPLVAI